MCERGLGLTSRMSSLMRASEGWLTIGVNVPSSAGSDAGKQFGVPCKTPPQEDGDAERTVEKYSKPPALQDTSYLGPSG